MMGGFALANERLAWNKKGFEHARYRGIKDLPDDAKARAAYLAGWRAGNRERIRAEAEGRP